MFLPCTFRCVGLLTVPMCRSERLQPEVCAVNVGFQMKLSGVSFATSFLCTLEVIDFLVSFGVLLQTPPSLKAFSTYVAQIAFLFVDHIY